MKTFTPLASTLMLTLLTATTIAADTATEPDKLAEPLILELKMQSGSALRQEILVSEGKAFRVTTDRQEERWIVEGDVRPIVDGVAVVNLKVSMFGPHRGTSANLGPMEMKLKIDEFTGCGFGVVQGPMVFDLWLRRGTDPVPPLARQLSAKREKAAAAARYLGALGAAAKLAIPALKKAAQREDEIVRTAALIALQNISGEVVDEAK